MTWAFWLAAIAIACASSVAIVRLLDHADTRRQTQIVLADISEVMSELRLAEVRAVVEAGSEEQLREAIAAAAPASSSAVGTLLRLDPEGDAADRVREAADQYRSNAQVHLGLLDSEQWLAAARWEDERSGPSFELLQEATAQTGVFYSAQAVRSLRRVRMSAVAAIGSEALLIGLLVTLSSRSRHAAARKLDEERLRHAARLQALVQHSAEAIALLDARTVVRYASSAVQRILGLPPEDAVGMSFLSFLESDSRSSMRGALQELVATGGELLALELAAHHADGSPRWIEVSASNLLTDPNVGGIVLNFRDVTQSRSLKEQLRHQAWHDALTGLANRELFGRQMEQRLTQERRERSPCAVLYLDLDGFKAVNDSLGHEAGDELLTGVAERLQEALREHETAARLGGDEFAVLLERAGQEEAEAVAQRLLDALSAPFSLSAGRASVGASIGIAVGGPDDGNPDELLRQADVAMYLAKIRGKNRYQVFQAGMSELQARSPRTPADLERALEREEFVLQ